MIDSYIAEMEGEGRCLVIMDSPTVARVVPLAALVGRRELLGYDDMAECLEAILHLQNHGGESANPYGDAYELLTIRELAREAEAARARTEGAPPGDVLARANQAAHDAVHRPSAGGVCVMDRCRGESRRKLGLPDPARTPGADTRGKPPAVPAKRPKAQRDMQPNGGKAQALDLIADQADYLHAVTRAFLHSLTGNEDDPLTDIHQEADQ